MAPKKSSIAFLSYARADSEFALRLARDLRSAGAPVWMDQLDIAPGERWDEAVEDALARCDRMLMVLSPAAVESDNVMDEVAYGLDEQKTVIPVLHLQCAVPFRLRRLQYADFRQEYEAGLTSLLRSLEPASVDERQALKAGEVRMNPSDGLAHVWIPDGEFQMGCSRGDTKCGGDEKPLHTVRLTHGFWLGQTPVTQAAYEKVTRANPSHFKGPQNPVENVNWDEARKYCEAVGGRLPTEAEWEYAARAGSQKARYGELDKIAWYHLNSSGETHLVGQKQANSWGLYDVLGNVWEWVADWYDERYYGTLSSPAIDPKGPPDGTRRVLRGGSWVVDATNLRVSSRLRDEPENRNNLLGFRCALDVIP